MQCVSLLVALFLGFKSMVLGNELTIINAEKSSLVSLDVIHPGQLQILRVQKGRSVPPLSTACLLNIALIDLYRKTVRALGDAVVEREIAIGIEHEESFASLRIKTLHHPGNDMTLGSALYGTGFVINSMLLPVQPDDGFWAGKWVVRHVGLTPEHPVPIGSIEVIAGTEAPHNSTFNASSPATSSTERLDALLLSPTGLTSPFPVPGTDITLLPGPRGANLNDADLVVFMSDLIIIAWSNVAVRHRVQPVGEKTWHSALRDKASVTLRPRMNGATSLFTNTDLAETAFGLAYLFLAHPPVTETTVAIVKRNASGRRIPIGEMEIRPGQPGIETGGFDNNGSVVSS